MFLFFNDPPTTQIYTLSLHDALPIFYMSANMFDYAASGSFQNVRLYAFNKAQMYAGAATIQVVSFDAPSSEFTLLDRKSTRLNSSHMSISYAVFCLKKKNTKNCHNSP